MHGIIYIYIYEPAAYFNLLLIALVGSCTNTLNFRYANKIFTENLAQARLISVMLCCVSLCIVSVRCSLLVNPVSFAMVHGPLLGQGLLIFEAQQSHWDKPHSIEILRTSGQPEAETILWQYTTSTLTRDRHACPRRDPNRQSQQATCHRPTT